MHPLPPRRTLRRLLAQYGPALLDDPARVDALLADLCGPHHRERFLLVHALRERIPAELLSQPQGGAVHGRRLSQRLQRRYGFSDEAAQWAIESWALALDIAPLTSRLPRPLAALVGRILPTRSYSEAVAHLPTRSYSEAIAHLSNIPLPQMRRPSSVFLTGANPQNRVQYANRVGRRLPGWAWLAAAVLIAVLVSGALLAGPLRTRWEGGSPPPQADAWQMPSAEQVHALLLAAFPLPREARIETELLNVRAEPSAEAQATGVVGPQGAGVTVDGFAADGRWAHISTPVEGWISNDFASYADEDGGVRLFIRPELLRIQIPGSKVFADPTANETELATLVADQIVIALGISTDESRLRIAAPVSGWIDSSVVQR